MKKGSLQHAGHFDPPYALEVPRPSVPLSTRSGILQLRENRSVPLKCPARVGGKPSNSGVNQPQTLLLQLKRPQTPPFSGKICSGTGRTHRAGHFDFPIHAKCPAEVSRCSPATVEAGVDASQTFIGDRVQAGVDGDAAGFRVVLADPSWTFRSNSRAAPGRNPRRHYPCLTADQLRQVPLERTMSAGAARHRHR